MYSDIDRMLVIRAILQKEDISQRDSGHTTGHTHEA